VPGAGRVVFLALPVPGTRIGSRFSAMPDQPGWHQDRTEESRARARPAWAALRSRRTTAPMMTRSSSIWMLTMIRARSVFGVMSPNPTVEKIVTAKYSARVWSRVPGR